MAAGTLFAPNFWRDESISKFFPLHIDIDFLCPNSHEGLPAFHKRYGKVVRIAPELVTVADKDMIREVNPKQDFVNSSRFFYEEVDLTHKSSIIQ